MLTALMSDIHGNREAFVACLAHARHHDVARYIFLGDYVGYGADPSWVLEQVMAHVARGAVALMGNHDAAISSPSERMNSIAEEAIAWTRTQLNAEQRKFLENLPIEYQDDDRLFVHASAHAPTRWDYVLGREDALRSLKATRCAKTFCGHVHVPALYHMTPTGKVGAFAPSAGIAIPLMARWRWLAVLGSVGQPRDRNPAACYALLDTKWEALTYCRVPYDTEAAAQKIRAAGLPIVLASRLERGS